LLFVLAADFLQTLLNKVKDLNMLNLPIPLEYTNDFRIIQYADDTLIIMEGCTKQLVFLKSLLQTFASSSGLKVNYSKSMMVPINVDDQKMQIMSSNFGCSIGAMPFTYLGLPLGTTKPKVSQAGRLQMTNAIFSALLTFHLCIFKMHKTNIKQIDMYRKHFLRRGADINAKTPPKAAWDLVCLPKSEGGLGVSQLESHNDALLLKNLQKFFNKTNIPWVHLVWKSRKKWQAAQSHFERLILVKGHPQVAR
jgi:hypothetical protein